MGHLLAIAITDIAKQPQIFYSWAWLWPQNPQIALLVATLNLSKLTFIEIVTSCWEYSSLMFDTPICNMRSWKKMITKKVWFVLVF